MRITMIDMPQLTAMGRGALCCTYKLTSFTAPQLTTMGDYALYCAPCREEIFKEVRSRNESKSNPEMSRCAI